MLETEVEAGEADNKHHGILQSREVHVDKELNLKGKVCPYTFVESMLLSRGDGNRPGVAGSSLTTDPPPADVPKSLTREGYEILEVGKINETEWAIVVRNKEFE